MISLISATKWQTLPESWHKMMKKGSTVSWTQHWSVNITILSRAPDHVRQRHASQAVEVQLADLETKPFLLPRPWPWWVEDGHGVQQSAIHIKNGALDLRLSLDSFSAGDTTDPPVNALYETFLQYWSIHWSILKSHCDWATLRMSATYKEKLQIQNKYYSIL